MKRSSIIFCLILLLIGAPVHAKTALTLMPAKEGNALRCEPKETKNGLQTVIRFTAPAGKAAGGEYQIYLDGLLLTSAQFQEMSLDKILDFPIATLTNGQHTIRCEVRTASDTYSAERSFTFDGSPTLTLAKPIIDKNGLLDATVSLGFFEIGDGENAGLLDVLIDARPVAQIHLTAKQAGTAPLSRLLGKGIAVGQLPVGTHLLALRASGFNGASTIARTSFTLDAPAELTLKKDKQGGLLEAQARFLPVEAGYPGSVEVWFDQDMLFARRAEKETTLAITREELLAALQKHGHVDLSRPVSLVFALRAMNGSERWQALELTP